MKVSSAIYATTTVDERVGSLPGNSYFAGSKTRYRAYGFLVSDEVDL